MDVSFEVAHISKNMRWRYLSDGWYQAEAESEIMKDQAAVDAQLVKMLQVVYALLIEYIDDDIKASKGPNRLACAHE